MFSHYIFINYFGEFVGTISWKHLIIVLTTYIVFNVTYSILCNISHYIECTCHNILQLACRHFFLEYFYFTTTESYSIQNIIFFIKHLVLDYNKPSSCTYLFILVIVYSTFVQSLYIQQLYWWICRSCIVKLNWYYSYAVTFVFYFALSFSTRLVEGTTNAWRILLHNERKSRHRRIKKQVCYERICCASSQLCLWVEEGLGRTWRVGIVTQLWVTGCGVVHMSLWVLKSGCLFIMTTLIWHWW